MSLKSHGSAATLCDVLDNAVHMGQAIPQSERADLVAYLLQIDGRETGTE